MPRLAQLLLGAALAAAPSAVRAATFKPYTDAAFAGAEKVDAPILIDIAAPWCPTCKAQAPIIQGLADQPAYRKLVVLHVDFDTQKDVVRAFGATIQSTLIVLHGKHLRAASVGSTSPKVIAALLAKSLH